MNIGIMNYHSGVFFIGFIINIILRYEQGLYINKY